jgi:hypothetical protein
LVGTVLLLVHPVVQSVYRASIVVIQVRSVGSLYILTRRKTGWTVAEVWEEWMTDKLLQVFLDPLSIEVSLNFAIFIYYDIE